MVDGQVLERLVGLAVDLLRDHLRLADGELEALAAHVLDEDGERELSTALHLPRIRTPDVDDLERHVADELLVETVLDHASGELVTLDLAHEGRGVGADGHRDGGVVDRDGRQRTHVFGVGDGLADRDVLEAGDGDDVAGAGGIGGVALEGTGLQQLGDARVLVGAVGADPGHGLALLQRAVEDAQQCETAQERAGVEVGDPGLQRVLVVVRGRGNVLEDRLEQRLEIVVVRQRSVGRTVLRCGTGTTGGVDDRHVEESVDIEVGHIVDQVGGETEQQVVRLFLDLRDAGVGAVGLVDQEDDGKLGLERLAQHEAGLRQRALTRVDEQHDTVDHGQAALDLATEVGVTGVSITLIVISLPWACLPLYVIAVFLARIVMPFSRSRSFESMARSST